MLGGAFGAEEITSLSAGQLLLDVASNRYDRLAGSAILTSCCTVDSVAAYLARNPTRFLAIVARLSESRWFQRFSRPSADLVREHDRANAAPRASSTRSVEPQTQHYLGRHPEEQATIINKLQLCSLEPRKCVQQIFSPSSQCRW